MRFGLFDRFGALNSKPVFAAFADSLKRAGHQVEYHDLNADVAVIWSVLWQGRMASNHRVWEHFHKNGKPIVILEIGALDRGNLWKVCLNHINGAGYFGPTGNDSKRRDNLRLNLKPWKQGEYIYICTQHPESQQWQGMPPINEWVKEQITEIRKHTMREIRVRPHPRSPMIYHSYYPNITIEYPGHVAGTYDSFDFNKVLDKAWAVVNHNSNIGTVAALNGIPIFVGLDSYAAPVGNFDLANIENPLMPDREQWANDLAYTEWTVEEISSGEPLDRLLSKLLV